FSEELRFVFITSEANVFGSEGGNQTNIEGLRVEVSKTDNQKCVRCWHSRSEVGQISGHESLCERCHENVEGKGEVRLFA
ncbi:MAG TPA: zinc finger domain-containing protein, partial [SAR86 cluster bacterium]|nr:zinc finger domain-containing protein [SAR86 cluster bacterium]